jgi:hypothetical protein
MLTIFAAPKPFRGHIGVIQRNAIRSWTLLRPACEIILMGNEEGIAEIAVEFGLQHVPDIARTTLGTPLVSGLFKQAEQSSDRPLLCYVNSDIILMSDFMEALQRVVGYEKRFLMVGHRWDLDVTDRLEFTPAWEETLRRQVKTRGTLAGQWSIDFFAFPRGELGEIPHFALGRPNWDNWMLYRARSLRMPLIDATPVVMAVHQNHDYAHHPGGKDGMKRGHEALTNATLVGDTSHKFALIDATHLLTAQKLRRNYDRGHLLRECANLLILSQWRPLKWVRNAVSTSRPLRSRFGLTLNAMLGRPEN